VHRMPRVRRNLPGRCYLSSKQDSKDKSESLHTMYVLSRSLSFQCYRSQTLGYRNGSAFAWYLGKQTEVALCLDERYFPKEGVEFYIPKVGKDFYIPRVSKDFYVPRTRKLR